LGKENRKKVLDELDFDHKKIKIKLILVLMGLS